ncbi:hypothetical protein ACLB2K_037819 [Fragaria x ananassa]
MHNSFEAIVRLRLILILVLVLGATVLILVNFIEPKGQNHDSDPDSFPRPGPKYDETILAVPRLTSGKRIAAEERKAGRVPSIIFEQEDGHYGGNKRLISVRTNRIRKLVNQLGRPFLSRLYNLEVATSTPTTSLRESAFCRACFNCTRAPTLRLM